jgi:hypothetical protein
MVSFFIRGGENEQEQNSTNQWPQKKLEIRFRFPFHSISVAIKLLQHANVHCSSLYEKDNNSLLALTTNNLDNRAV